MKTSFLNALAAPLLHTSERDEIEPNKIQPNSNSARRLFGILGITAASCVLGGWPASSLCICPQVASADARYQDGLIFERGVGWGR